MKSVIVVPIYKSNLSELERANLTQMADVFEARHDVFFVGPEAILYKEHIAIWPSALPKKMHNRHFKSIKSYNKLLLSSAFYQVFEQYDYLLICQLDVWLIKDELDSWAKKSYSYIGAPWLELPPLTKKINLLPMGKWMLNKVGNGGFSLRKVQDHLRIAKYFYWIPSQLLKNEDFFWGVVAPKYFKFFRTPDIAVAAQFCIELNPELGMKLTNQELPFALHAWEKHQPEFWRTYLTLPQI